MKKRPLSLSTLTAFALLAAGALSVAQAQPPLEPCRPPARRRSS